MGCDGLDGIRDDCAASGVVDSLVRRCMYLLTTTKKNDDERANAQTKENKKRRAHELRIA